MQSLEEKNQLSNELERVKKRLEEAIAQKTDLLKELQKSKLEAENIRRQMLQQEIHHNIQQTEALTRNLSPAANIKFLDNTSAAVAKDATAGGENAADPANALGNDWLSQVMNGKIYVVSGPNESRLSKSSQTKFDRLCREAIFFPILPLSNYIDN